MGRFKNGERKIKKIKIKLKKNKIIAGVDEVGRGCLAGPVVSAAVILKTGVKLKNLKDSKKLNFEKRMEISKDIKNNSYFAIGIASVKEIEKLNILQASLLSMKRAILNLSKRPDLVLVDGIFSPDVSHQCKTIIKGDQSEKNIMAASILAKVYRDNYMKEIDPVYPQYGFKQHKGYPTKMHLEALKLYGVTDEHRLSFKPVKMINEPN